MMKVLLLKKLVVEETMFQQFMQFQMISKPPDGAGACNSAPARSSGHGGNRDAGNRARRNLDPSFNPSMDDVPFTKDPTRVRDV